MFVNIGGMSLNRGGAAALAANGHGVLILVALVVLCYEYVQLCSRYFKRILQKLLPIFVVYFIYQAHQTTLIVGKDPGMYGCAYDCHLNMLMADYKVEDYPFRTTLAVAARIFYRKLSAFRKEYSGGVGPFESSSYQPLFTTCKDPSLHELPIQDLKNRCRTHLESEWSLFRYDYPHDLVTYLDLYSFSTSVCENCQKDDATSKHQQQQQKTLTLDKWVENIARSIFYKLLPFTSPNYTWPEGWSDVLQRWFKYLYDMWSEILFFMDFCSALVLLTLSEHAYPSA